MLLLQNVFLVTILLVCVCLIEELEREKRNTAKTIDNLKAVNARQNSLHELWLFQLVWVKKGQTVQKIVNERKKIRALLSFQSTLLTELLVRTLYIVYAGQTIQVESRSFEEIPSPRPYCENSPLSKFCRRWLPTPNPDFFLLKIATIRLTFIRWSPLRHSFVPQGAVLNI